MRASAAGFSPLTTGTCSYRTPRPSTSLAWSGWLEITSGISQCSSPRRWRQRRSSRQWSSRETSTATRLARPASSRRQSIAKGSATSVANARTRSSSSACTVKAMRMKKAPPSGSVEYWSEVTMLASRAARKPETAATIPWRSAQEISSRASIARRLRQRDVRLPDASMQAAEEADLLGGRAVGVAHEGREVGHLLGVERLGLRAAHRPEADGALPARLQQLRDARLRAGGGAPAALGDRRRRQAAVAQVAEGRRAQAEDRRRVLGDGRRVEDMEDDVVGEVALGQRLQRAALEHRAHRRAHALQARRDERVGQLALRGPPAGARQLAERAVVVEPRVDLGAVAVHEVVQARLVVGQPGAHDPLVAGQPVQARPVGGVGVGGLRGGGDEERSGEDEEEQAVSHVPCNGAVARRGAPP